MSYMSTSHRRAPRSQANRIYRVRSKLEPAGKQECPPEPYDQKVDDDTWPRVIACTLARTKHEVGDAFSVEHIWPTPMVDLQCGRELFALHGDARYRV